MSGFLRVAERAPSTGTLPPDTALLNALDGVAYLASPSGRILALGAPGWEAAAASAGASALQPSAMIGRSLFDAITSDEVAHIYRRIHEHVTSGGRHVAYEYRCDAPDVRRTMRLSVSSVRAEPGEVRLLYQSQVLSAVERPWMSLFEPGRILAARAVESSLPIVRVCAFCHAVTCGEAAPWRPPEAFYAEGGPVDVRVSHGVCPQCRGRFDDLLEGV